jgi:aspartyl protease family protein
LPERYTLIRTGNLLLARAAVTGPGGTKVINLLVDTGSTYTILPVEVLESTGLSPAESERHQRIATGSGYVIAPVVRVRRLSTLGRHFHRFPVIAHTLPFGGPIDGLLGMDVLSQLKAKIAVAYGSIEVE